jgi:RHS repeat-associated protein
LIRFESRPVTPQVSWRRVEWQYDAFGRRIRQTTSDGSSGSWQVTEDLKCVSDPVLFGRHVAELSGTDNALVRSYAWGLDLSGTMQGAGGVGGLLWMTIASGTNAGTYFYAYDGNGNVTALINAAGGTRSAVYEYGPFGELLRATGPVGMDNPFQFSSKRREAATGLVLFEYRVYSADCGRWITPDPKNEISFAALNGPLVRKMLLEEAGRMPTSGQPNDYAVSKNAGPNMVDVLGLLAISGQTIVVSKCEIVIVYGHGSRSNPLSWKTSKSGCAAGAAVMCWPGRNISGLGSNLWPEADGLDAPVWWINSRVDPNRSEDGVPRDNLNRILAPVVLQQVVAEAQAAAKGFCGSRCCCQVVAIKFVRVRKDGSFEEDASKPNRDGDGVPSMRGQSYSCKTGKFS